ncbi:MAG: hypothetical protein A3D10_09390 [Omnitrophica WOR_2 bacterium RIFCSPHIGHO2_02_FULL_48_11]|nr:MAG: hypothetical protein A3D10_09390 [Omnitrophica WOR_2 bacterium RIFCSPHIGHO2_02_FULL_48_11]
MGEKNPQSAARSESDRRYFPRWEVQNRVLYRLENAELTKECQSRDINCSGACLCSEQNLLVNQRLKLTLFLADNVSVHVDGKVLWTQTNHNDYLIGVNFVDTHEEIQGMILQYAFELKKSDLVKHWFKGWKS